MTDEAADRLETHRRDGESFSQFVLRVAAMLDDDDDGTTVTDRNVSADGYVSDGDLLTTEEFVARMDDLEAQLPPSIGDELEMRFR